MKKNNYIKTIVFSLVISLVLCIPFYFLSSLTSLLLPLVVMDILVFFIGSTGLGLKKLESKGYNKTKLQINLVCVATMLSIPMCCLFLNLQITEANKYTPENVLNIKKEILFNLDKSLLTKNREQYYLYVSGHDLTKFKFVREGKIDFYYEKDNAYDDTKYISKMINENIDYYKNKLGLNSDFNMTIAIVDKMVLDRTIGSYISNNDITLLTSKVRVDEMKQDYESRRQTMLTTYEESIFHEYAHQVLMKAADERNISFERLPNWLIEGTAVYIAAELSGKELYTSNGKLKDLDKDKRFKGIKAQEYYTESGYFITYLYDNYGDNVIEDILDNMKDNDIYEAIEKVTGKKFDELLDLY